MDLQTENVTVRIKDKVVLDNINVHAPAGQILALVGPSGSGKTTLLNVLGQLQHVSSGAVQVGGQDAAKWKDSRRRKFWHDHAAFIFQDYGLIEEESIAYNVALSKVSLFGSIRDKKKAIEQTLEQVGLPGRGADRVSTLSGGEKQRVGFARAIFKAADVILADEPTASLDTRNREIVADMLRKEATRGATVIIATHDLELAATCDSQLTMTFPAS